MIFLHFSVQNPFKSFSRPSKTYFDVSKQISNTKIFQIELAKMSECLDLFELTLDLRWFGIDQAGPRLDLSIGRYMFSINLYDRRSWDDRNHTWHNK